MMRTALLSGSLLLAGCSLAPRYERPAAPVPAALPAPDYASLPSISYRDLFRDDGLQRLIEVKTTNGWERTPFHITRNELAVAEERRSEWRLFRLWNFSREPKAFELHPPLDAHVSLTATTFQASFH